MMRIVENIAALLLVMLLLGCERSNPAGLENADTEVSPPPRGYVMARWNEEIPDVEYAGDCPFGFNVTEEDYFPEQWAVWMAERLRLRDQGGYLPWDDDRLPPDACQDPLAQPDPGFLTFDGPAIVYGLDLDGQNSRQLGAQGGSCAHDDFAGHTGERGIDNQSWRLMGCVRGYRPNDLIDRLHEGSTSIKEGGFALLMEISGMDDPMNDDEIEVQLLSANHPVTVDAGGDLMHDVSYTAHENTRYHNEVAKGKIENGILTTEPVDFRIKAKQQTMDNEFWFRDARLRGEVQPDGRITGIVGAYWDMANMFSTLNDQWIGQYHQGRNAAQSRGFMCAGIYHAMPRVADGHPDPETGRCTSISTALHFEAVPAFVIRPALAMAD
ncbi:MAG: hypothetical protein GY910_04130 [bacterium]|nr:hypothetical protein [bacterium]